MKKDELQNYLITEAEYEEEEVLAMTDYELLDSYLIYEGIIGYTDTILDAVSAAFDVKIDY